MEITGKHYLANRFFGGDLLLEEDVSLTEEEIDIFEKKELEILVVSGLKNISGGYSKITIEDAESEADEGEDEILDCEFEAGEQGEDGTSKDTWYVEYNRVTKEFSTK
jgi:hypothetical protein